MGRFIDEEELQKYIMHDGCEKGCGYIDERDLKYIPTVEAIPKVQYENHLKADMVAMLEDLKQDIIAEAYGIETDCSDYVVNVADIDMVIQQKINTLKGIERCLDH